MLRECLVPVSEAESPRGAPLHAPPPLLLRLRTPVKPRIRVPEYLLCVSSRGGGASSVVTAVFQCSVVPGFMAHKYLLSVESMWL